MKKWIIAGLATYCVSTALAEIRTFTAADGRTLKAELVRYIEMKDLVELKREDGKKLTVSPSAFAEEDQKYIQKWYAGQVFLSESLFKLDVTRSEESKTKKEQEVNFSEQSSGRRSGAGTQIVAVDERTKYAINLTLENKSNVKLSNVMLEYRVYYDQQKAVVDEKNQREDRPEGEPERHMAVDETKVKEGSSRLKPAEPGSERTVTPTTVTLLKRSQNSRAYGEMINLKSNLQGAWIRLTMKDVDGKTLTRDVATSNSIMKKFPWETPEELLATDQPAN